MKNLIINIIIIVLTLILTLLILFYDPYKEYLAVYKNSLNIVYDITQTQYFWNVDKHTENHSWEYTLSNDNISVIKKKDGYYKVSINKDGITDLKFSYTDGNEEIYSINYKFEIKGNKILWKEGNGSGLFNYPNPIK